MILPDINVLVYAYDRASPHHTAYRTWLQNLLAGDAAFGLSDIVLSGFLRIVTHARILTVPLLIGEALAIVEELRGHPNCVVINPGERHWRIFTGLCSHINATANSVPDAYLAAIAIGSGSLWLTADKGFARFPGLKWRHPLSE